MLLVGWQKGHSARKKLEWWGAGVVICLEQGADLHMAGPADVTATHWVCVCVCVCGHEITCIYYYFSFSSACGRKDIWPVKNCVVGFWHGYLSGARCRLVYCPADATATHSLSLASVKSRLVIPFWYRLTGVVLDKGPLNGCVFSCEITCVYYYFLCLSVYRCLLWWFAVKSRV